MMAAQEIIHVRNLVTAFGSYIVHNHLNFFVYAGEILGIVGGSGSGKTVLLDSILGLHKPYQGDIKLFGYPQEFFIQKLMAIKLGVLFQHGALFSSLNVFDNIAFPMREIAHLKEELIAELVPLKLALVGLPVETCWKKPEELSGGMVKRVALARALALDPKLLFLDEPTAGLDPIAAGAFDELILTLKRNLNLTVVMITHDLESLRAICTRVAVLVDKNIITGTLKEIEAHPHPWIQHYFKGRQAAMR